VPALRIVLRSRADKLLSLFGVLLGLGLIFDAPRMALRLLAGGIVLCVIGSWSERCWMLLRSRKTLKGDISNGR